MEIKNSNIKDLEQILKLYEKARNLQLIKGAVLWPIFDESLIKKEISENRQWKIIIDNQIACVWATTFSDPQIWNERNIDPSIYIHRIATNPIYRGMNLVSEIVKWSKDFAKENAKQFIRLDTVGENMGLIEYYQKCGFDFLGLKN
jgi:GNAT superfamily N-acetyltransferase